MKIRYIIEYKRPDPNKWDFIPIGVWAHGVDDRSAFEVGYVSGFDAEEWDAQCVVNRIVEQGIRELPEDFLERHRDAVPVYLGSRTIVFESDKYGSVTELVDDVIGQIRKGRID
ncbi:MAG: hypothetical protein BWY28_02825 [bacterium ADurb.Bin236]|nr:MAG: hypothetical protein BWY28_02825 [bacterium ADurb.Bin236]